MIINSIVAFIHFLAGFGVIAAVLIERVLLKQKLSPAEAKRLRLIDGVYGLSALLVLGVGFLRVFYFEKGSAFYFSNPMFHLKLSLFIVVGLLSIYPTVRFMKWKKLFKGNNILKLEDREFRNIKRILNIEIGLLVLLLFAASLMARGLFYL